MTSYARGTPPRDENHHIVSQPATGLDSIAFNSSYDRGQTIHSEGQPSTHWFRMIAGAALCSTLRADGRRLVVDLLLPGDFFGFATGHDHHCTVEALVDGTKASKYDRRSAEGLADRSSSIARELRTGAIAAMDRRRTHLLVVGRTTAQQKVASFLLELADRMCCDEREELHLPISRYDIADYLAISTETVSRSFSSLQRTARIEMVSPQHIRILDREGLEECEDPQLQCLRPN